MRLSLVRSIAHVRRSTKNGNIFKFVSFTVFVTSENKLCKFNLRKFMQISKYENSSQSGPFYKTSHGKYSLGH
jgi:hypothetical protein